MLVRTARSLCQKQRKDVEVLEETVSEDGQSAVVKLKLTYGNGKTDTQKEKLVMTENGWRPAK